MSDARLGPAADDPVDAAFAELREYVAVRVEEHRRVDVRYVREGAERLAARSGVGERERGLAVERDHTAERMQVRLRGAAVLDHFGRDEQRPRERERGGRGDRERSQQALLDRARREPAVRAAAHFTSEANRSSFELISKSPRTALRRLMRKPTRSPIMSSPTSPPSDGKSNRSATVKTGVPWCWRASSRSAEASAPRTNSRWIPESAPSATERTSTACPCACWPVTTVRSAATSASSPSTPITNGDDSPTADAGHDTYLSSWKRKRAVTSFSAAPAAAPSGTAAAASAISAARRAHRRIRATGRRTAGRSEAVSWRMSSGMNGPHWWIFGAPTAQLKCKRVPAAPIRPG